jgi:hypothetical protein
MNDMEIIYKEGRKHKNTDALSRIKDTGPQHDIKLLGLGNFEK